MYNKIITSLFLILIFMPLIFWSLNSDVNIALNEKRSLSSMPSFSIENLGSYPKLYEQFFNDNFKLRNLLVFTNNFLKVNFLRTSTNESITIGTDGRLFLTPELTQTENKSLELFSKTELEEVKKNLKVADQYFARNGTKFYFVLAPASQSIYPEFLPAHLQRLYKNTRLKQLSDYLKDTNFRYIDPTDSLIKSKSKHGQIYYRYDLHWNMLGSFIAYREIMEKISGEFPNIVPRDLNDYEVSYKTSPQKDLENLAGLSGYFSETEPILSSKSGLNFKIENPDCADLYNRCSHVLTQHDNKSLPKLVMYRDSFGSWLIPFLSQHFSKATYIWQPVPMTTEIIKSEKPDIVIFEISERSLWTLTKQQFAF